MRKWVSHCYQNGISTMTNSRTTTQSKQTAKQSPDTLMWIYVHSLVHYVKLTRNETTVASVMGCNQEWKNCQCFSFLAPPGRISASIIVHICPSSSASAGALWAALRDAYIIAKMKSRSLPHDILMQLAAGADLHACLKERDGKGESETFFPSRNNLTKQQH